MVFHYFLTTVMVWTIFAHWCAHWCQCTRLSLVNISRMTSLNLRAWTALTWLTEEKFFSKVVRQMSSPIRVVYAIQLIHIFANTCCCQTLKFWPSWWVWSSVPWWFSTCFSVNTNEIQHIFIVWYWLLEFSFLWSAHFKPLPIFLLHCFNWLNCVTWKFIYWSPNP